MLIDYQISESDYVHGERLVMRPHTERKDISKILGSSFAGLLLIIAAILDLLRSGFTPINVLLVLSGLFFLLSIPLLRAFLSRGIRQHARIVYQNTDWLRGRLFLEVNEEGAQFTFAGHSIKTRWPEFMRFLEDRRTFILLQRNPESPPPLIFHIVPKHNLSHDQIEVFRRYLKSNVGKKTALGRSPISAIGPSSLT